jgi:hypothetical protein
MECGTTANACNGKTGMYALEYTIPDPSYVRYRYTGEAWREVKDSTRNLNYRIEKVSSPGQASGVKYRIATWTKADLYYNNPGPVDRYDGTAYPFYGTPGDETQFTGPITSVRFFDSGSSTLRVEVTHATRKDIFNARHFAGPNATGGNAPAASLSHYWLPSPPDTSYRIHGLNFFRVDGQPEPERWRFQVFDALNNVVFTREETTQPEAAIVPEVYGNNKGSFNIGNSDPTKLLKVVSAIEANRKVVNVFLGTTLIQKLISPIGATLYPRVCWDCDGEKKCPPGTCSVDCGDKVCCYNSLGISVKEFKK